MKLRDMSGISRPSKEYTTVPQATVPVLVRFPSLKTPSIVISDEVRLMEMVWTCVFCTNIVLKELPFCSAVTSTGEGSKWYSKTSVTAEELANLATVVPSPVKVLSIPAFVGAKTVMKWLGLSK